MRSSTTGGACTRAWATEPRPRRGPTWRRSSCQRPHEVLISPLHSPGAGPVRYLALAENVRDPGKGYVEARVVHSFGREDQLDRAALERLVRSIRRVLGEDAGN